MTTVLYTADVVCPMNGPPIQAGGVLVADDRIVAVEASARLRPDADRVHEVEGVLLPGLVDASTRFEWSDLGDEPIEPVVQPEVADPLTAAWDADRWQRSARRGVQEAVRAGVTAAADVVVRGPGVPAAARAGVAGTSFVEIHDVTAAEGPAVLSALDHALSRSVEPRGIGVALRSAATVDSEVLTAISDLAARRQVRVHIPCARTRAEVEALRRGTGPLVVAAAARDRRYAWPGGMTPVEHLAAHGALGPRTAVVHGVWVAPDDAIRLADHGVAVVATPRMDRRVGAGQAPLELYADAGVRLALGTGGAPFAVDADLLDEAAAWVRLATQRGLAGWPAASGRIGLEEHAVRMLTVDGAAAVGLDGEAGVLAAGRRADFVAVAVAASAEDVYPRLVRDGPGRQVLTVLGGIARARRGQGDWPAIDRRVSSALPLADQRR